MGEKSSKLPIDADFFDPPKKKKKPLPAEAMPYRWQKGQSGNPEGARRHNPIRRALKHLTVESYRKVITAVCTGNMANLESMIDDPKISALQVGVARAFLKAMREGDYHIIERIAERIVGKIPDELNLNSKNLNANIAITDDKFRSAVRKAVEELEEEV